MGVSLQVLPDDTSDASYAEDVERAKSMSFGDLINELSCLDLIYALECALNGGPHESKNPYFLRFIELAKERAGKSFNKKMALKEELILLERQELIHRALCHLTWVVKGARGIKNSDRHEASKVVLNMSRTFSPKTKIAIPKGDPAEDPPVLSGVTEFQVRAARSRQAEGKATPEDLKLLKRFGNSQGDADDEN